MQSESELFARIREILKFRGIQPKGFLPAKEGRGGKDSSPEQWRITCSCSRSASEASICPQHGAVRHIPIFQTVPEPRERKEWSEAKWFRESARTEHRSEAERSEGRSGYTVVMRSPRVDSVSFGCAVSSEKGAQPCVCFILIDKASRLDPRF